jgi:hypothetical protein
MVCCDEVSEKVGLEGRELKLKLNADPEGEGAENGSSWLKWFDGGVGVVLTVGYAAAVLVEAIVSIDTIKQNTQYIKIEAQINESRTYQWIGLTLL